METPKENPYSWQNMLILVIVLCIGFVLYKIFVKTKPKIQEEDEAEESLDELEQFEDLFESEYESELSATPSVEAETAEAETAEAETAEAETAAEAETEMLNLLLFIFYTKYFNELGQLREIMGIKISQQQEFNSKSVLNYIYEFIADNNMTDLSFETFNTFSELQNSRHPFYSKLTTFSFKNEGFSKFNEQILNMLKQSKVKPKRKKYTVDEIINLFDFQVYG